MPDSAISRRSPTTRDRSANVVSSDTSNVRRLRLFTPTSAVFKRSARSSSAASCTSTSTPMPSAWAHDSNAASWSSSKQAAINKMQSAPIARDS